MATKKPCELVVIPELNLSAVGKRWKAVETLLFRPRLSDVRPGNRCKDNHSRLSRHCNPLLARAWGVGGLGRRAAYEGDMKEI